MSVIDQVRPLRAPRHSEPPTGRHLRVVERTKPRTARRILAALGITAMFLVLFITVAFHVELVKEQQRLDALNAKSQVAQATYDRLRLQADQLASPNRIIARARALGMVDAVHPIWLAPIGGGATDANSGQSSRVQQLLDVKPYMQETP